MPKVIIKKDSKYRVLYDTPKHIRYILLYGGRATGRSFQGSRSEVINLATKPYYRGFLMRNVLDTVRDSIYQDCLDRIDEMGLEQVLTVESKLILKYKQNQLKGRGFRKSSGSDTAKNKSVAGINRITIEEAEETDKEDFDQMDLSLRTTKGQVVIALLFNPPVKGHWILKEWFNLVPATKQNAHKYFKKCWYEDVEDKFLEGFFLLVPKSEREESHYIFGTYHENIKHLDQNTINKMERYKETDIDYYLHKVCGLVPSGKTGRVFKQYSIIPFKEYNDLSYSPRYGLDFGFNHPSAGVEIKIHNENLYIDEIMYETGLTNPNIAKKLSWITTKITADSAEPKSIEELNSLGLYVEASKKGPDSVTNGIQKMKQYKIFVTDRSKNLLNELENYSWKLDKNKEPTDIPEDSWNHCFTGDTLITTIIGQKAIKDIEVNDLVLTRLGYRKVLKVNRNGLKKSLTYRIVSSNTVLRLSCTPDHRIFTKNRGWQSISNLKINDIICYLPKTLMEKSIKNTKTKDILQEEEKNYIKKSGNSIMEQYQKASIYITKMKTQATIRLQTLKWLRLLSTLKNTAGQDLKKIKNGLKYFIKKVSNLQKFGILQKKVSSGIANMPLPQLSILMKKPLRKFVKCVSQNITQLLPINPRLAFAQINVNLPGEEGKTWIKQQVNVNSVEKNLNTLNLKNLPPVRDLVVTDIEIVRTQIEEVYDLTIEDQHEYFANSVLVHNCIDAIRYGIEGVGDPEVNLDETFILV